MRCLLLVVLLSVTPPSAAGDSQHRVDVIYDGKVISIHVEADLHARPALLREIINDYDSLSLLLPMISYSELMTRRSDGGARVRTDIRVCVLFICRIFRQVVDVSWHGNGGLAKTLPTQSDFHAGQLEWEVDGLEDGPSRLIIEARYEPRASVPPLIGPWLVQRKIRREVAAGLHELEYLTAATRQDQTDRLQ